ncbi:hypothetical protein D3C86_1950690 [compost metagenome]
MLLDEEHTRPAFHDHFDHGRKVVDQFRRQAFRWFVQKQNLRIAHQRTTNRKHLLLPARHRGSRLRLAFVQDWEEGVDTLQGPVPAPLGSRAEPQVFLDTQVRQDMPALRREGQSK